MALTDIPWTGTQADKLYLQSGTFSSTLKTSEAVTVIDSNPTDISWDGTNTPWIGAGGDKLYLNSGQFTSTIKDSESVNVVDATPNGVSWDGTNTPWSGAAAKKLYLQSGQHTSTLKTSHATGLTGQVGGISWDGTNTPWGDDVPSKMFLQSGQFTATIKDSEDVDAIESFGLKAVSWNGTNTPWAGSSDDKLYLQSGQFTSTLKTSQSVSAVDNNPTGIEVNDVSARIPSPDVTGDGAFSLPLLFGFTNNTIELPIFGVQGGSGATGAVSLPLLEVLGGSGATGDITFPIMAVTSSGTPAATIGNIPLPLLDVAGSGVVQTVDAAFDLPMLTVLGQTGALGELTFPVLAVTSSGFSPGVSITLPIVTVNASMLHKEVDITLPMFTISSEEINRSAGSFDLPMFTTSTVVQQGHVESILITLPKLKLDARSGLVVSNTLPSLSLSANGYNGYLVTFDQDFPRMIVNVKATQHGFGIADLTLPRFNLSNNVLTGIVSVSGSNRTIPMPTLNAHAFRGENGDGDLSLLMLELTAFAPAAPDCTFSQDLLMLTLDAFADVHVNRII